jgi:DNA polymerase III subunit beta
MNIIIPVGTLGHARKLLTRVRFERLKLPVLTHVLATVDAAGLVLAVTDLDQRLEIRLAASLQPHEPRSFLIPAEALAAAARGDKATSATFECCGDAKQSSLKLTVTCGGMAVETLYHPEPAEHFPDRPVVDGSIVALPKETFRSLAIVATCVSSDATRQILNGVCFTPENDGMLVATDGRRLAGSPAKVPAKAFVLPTASVHVLCHPDFFARDSAVVLDADPESRLIRFRSGPLTLITTTLEGNFPGYRHVIPRQFNASVTIPETRKPAIIAWLRSLRGQSNCVTLNREEPGTLTLTHSNYATVGAITRVPVDTEGEPPLMSFNPAYLADALEIGSTLQLVDGLNPGMTTDPSGAFCVIMNRHTPAWISTGASAEVVTTSVAA